MAAPHEGVTRTIRAQTLGVSRGSMYYQPKMPDKDWKLKCEIETVLREHPSYGSPRIALALKRNHKPIERVMQLFGIKAYRRRAKRWRNPRPIPIQYPNLLMTTTPLFRGHIWATDFTEVWWWGKKLYVSTVIDLYTREIMGVSIGMRKGVHLTATTLWNALLAHPRPLIFHSDNGSEYRARSFVSMLMGVGILISRTKPGCPWENGYQESFYDKFKVDLGDTHRFSSFGELIAEVYRTIWVYNHTRIHTSLRMPPVQFALLQQKRHH